ncbi:hypothetical protein FB565_008593 [Actinoplanes lutulentus]|uniref:hypothetical protein n=1 Tax=Actinoplanes lutulentus TaxID=1287878 RepID=UPI0011B93C04|nr:hypothetical protein [Actinoplanes lutulentus]MBB2948807.1 hypothetical protein [Actinoplanes lutulentus]
MSQPSADDVHRLLNAFRSTLDGTCSASTKAVPAALAGHVVDPETGIRRPLGQTRQLLLGQVDRAFDLTPLERTVVSLSYGLHLLRMPATHETGPSMATLLPAPAASTGRPRTSDPHLLGVNGVRHCRSKALAKLAAVWTPEPGPEPVVPAVEPAATKAAWFRHATTRLDEADRFALVLNALRSARRTCGSVPEIRDELWLDLDWWEFRNARSRLGVALGRPDRPVNQVRLARAEARMSIALWDLLAGVRETAARNTGSLTSLVVPSRFVSDIVGLDSPVEAARSAIVSLEQQGLRGVTDPDLALLVAWLEPTLPDELDAEWCGRAAAVVTRAAADHPALQSMGSNWFDIATARGAPVRVLAEAALNLSVAYSARRRYAESAHALNSFAPSAGTDPLTAGLLAIGQAAWRRRALSEVLRSHRTFDLDRARQMAADGVRHSQTAVEQIRRAGADGISAELRATVRLAEALALGSALLHTTTVRPGRAAAALSARATTLFDTTADLVSRHSATNDLLAYERARFQVITDIAHSLERGDQMTEFGVLSRARRL